MDHQQHRQQTNSGLTRYRSAPSSYFADLMNFTGYGSVGEDSDQFLKASSPDSDRFFSRFMSSCGAEESNSTNLCEIGRNPLVNEPIQSQFMAPIKHEPDVINLQQQQQGVYTSLSQLDHKPFLPKLGVEMGGGSNSNLIRHSSSPAGLLAQINVDNGYGVMRGLGSFGAGSVANAEASFSSASRVRNQMDFPAGAPSSSGIMPRASEIVGCTESGRLGKSRRNDASYMTGGLPTTSWDDSALLSDNFLKGLAENERKTFSNLNSLENQSGEGGTQTPTVLAHHLSLPTSSAMEKLLQFQDSVPLRIRAKRGYATHPRSIAERVRRTRISERMRKLQELVPNMEKQTNTADMLDLAVDYIKGLQQQVQTLSDNRAKCSCSNNQKK